MLATPSLPGLLSRPVVHRPLPLGPVAEPPLPLVGLSVGTAVVTVSGFGPGSSFAQPFVAFAGCTPPVIECADDPEEDEDLVEDEDDLPVAQPAADDESSFDDFDDEFDDDFEEEENDPDWDHPDDTAHEPPPPGKGPGKKK